MSLGDKFHAADTNYTEAPDDQDPEAAYDAGAYNFQIVDHSDDIEVLCSRKEMRDHLLKLLLANPLPE